MHTRIVLAWLAGVATPILLWMIAAAFDTATGRHVWAKRPIAINRDFGGIRLPGHRGFVWCRHCHWTCTGPTHTTTAAIRAHRPCPHHA